MVDDLLRRTNFWATTYDKACRKLFVAAVFETVHVKLIIAEFWVFIKWNNILWQVETL